MDGKIIIIQGHLASGKSTFARHLSAEINVPYLIKDTFKSAICASVQFDNREESSRFSAVTFNAMTYVTERIIETGGPLIIEGNFVPAGVKKVDEAGIIKALLKKHSCTPLTYKFVGDPLVLYKRFTEREKSPDRGRANLMYSEVKRDDFIKWRRNLDGFYVGGDVVIVDTTDFGDVDFAKHVETARKFLRV